MTTDRQRAIANLKQQIRELELAEGSEFIKSVVPYAQCPWKVRSHGHQLLALPWSTCVREGAFSGTDLLWDDKHGHPISIEALCSSLQQALSHTVGRRKRSMRSFLQDACGNQQLHLVLAENGIGSPPYMCDVIEFLLLMARLSLKCIPSNPVVWHTENMSQTEEFLSLVRTESWIDKEIESLITNMLGPNEPSATWLDSAIRNVTTTVCTSRTIRNLPWHPDIVSGTYTKDTPLLLQDTPQAGMMSVEKVWNGLGRVAGVELSTTDPDPQKLSRAKGIADFLGHIGLRTRSIRSNSPILTLLVGIWVRISSTTHATHLPHNDWWTAPLSGPEGVLLPTFADPTTKRLAKAAASLSAHP